jgi:hypothetical protein
VALPARLAVLASRACIIKVFQFPPNPLKIIARFIALIRARPFSVRTMSSLGGPLSVSDFAAIQKSLVEEDEKRESLIKRSRDVLKHSKQAIYALQRGDTASADALISSAKAAALPLLELLVLSPQLRFGAMSAALEEWAEAYIFSVFLKEKRIATMAELEIGASRAQLQRTTRSIESDSLTPTPPIPCHRFQ